MGVLTGAEFARVVALFHVGRHCTPRQLALATGVTLMQLVLWAYFFWRGQQLEYVTRAEPVTLMVMVAVVAFAALGLVLRPTYAYIDVRGKQRDQQARLATAQERARVSREMHDILGHTLAVIVGLADGAAALAEAKPERGARALRLIGRDALAELRRLLAVIGDETDGRDGSHGVPLAPQPGPRRPARPGPRRRPHRRPARARRPHRPDPKTPAVRLPHRPAGESSTTTANSKTASAWTTSKAAPTSAGTAGVTLAALAGLLHPAAPRPKSPCAGLTLYAVLRELQKILGTWTGACSICGQPTPTPEPHHRT